MSKNLHQNEVNLLKVNPETQSLWTEAAALDLVHSTTSYSKALEEQVLRQKREELNAASS